MQPDGLVRSAGTELIVDYSRFYPHAEVGSDIEIGQLCIYVCIDYRYQIDAYKGENAQVAIPAVRILSLPEGFRYLWLGNTVYISGRQKVVDAAGIPISLGCVFVGLHIVFIHLAVPRQCICASGEASVYNR